MNTLKEDKKKGWEQSWGLVEVDKNNLATYFYDLQMDLNFL